jgi:type IV secretory pathway VirB10-like protein
MKERMAKVRQAKVAKEQNQSLPTQNPPIPTPNQTETEAIVEAENQQKVKTEKEKETLKTEGVIVTEEKMVVKTQTQKEMEMDNQLKHANIPGFEGGELNVYQVRDWLMVQADMSSALNWLIKRGVVSDTLKKAVIKEMSRLGFNLVI